MTFLSIAINNDLPIQPLRPFCMACNWRKGGPDSWNGFACKCGFSEPPLKKINCNHTWGGTAANGTPICIKCGTPRP